MGGVDGEKINMTIKKTQDRPLESQNFSNLFAASIGFNDPQKTRAFTTIYTMMQMVDEVSEQQLGASGPSHGESRKLKSEIKRLQQSIEFCYSDVNDSSQINLALLSAISIFQIPEKIWQPFFKTMTMDLSPRGFKSLHDFFGYAHGAAGIPLSIFYLLCISQPQEHGFYGTEYADRAMRAGELLGKWMLSIHVLSVLHYNLKYSTRPWNLLPLDLLSKHKVSYEDLIEAARKNQTPISVRQLIIEFMSQANSYGSAGSSILKEICSCLTIDEVHTLAIPSAIYQEIYRRIEQREFDIFNVEPIWTSEDRSKLIGELESIDSLDKLVEKI